MGIMLVMVGALVVAVVIAIVVDRRRSPSGSNDHADSHTSNRSGKGHDGFNWPTGGGHGGDA